MDYDRSFRERIDGQAALAASVVWSDDVRVVIAPVNDFGLTLVICYSVLFIYELHVCLQHVDYCASHCLCSCFHYIRIDMLHF